MLTIRAFRDEDWTALRDILLPVFRAGKTYVYPTDISEEKAREYWIALPQATFVAVEEGEGSVARILGTYYIKPNQPGLGSHVCNCGYVVAPEARGRGVATALCLHSQSEAVARGFHAMQFNLVVSTNETAVRLWQSLGFGIVGRLPGAFRHPAFGYVDAFVMYKVLVS